MIDKIISIFNTITSKAMSLRKPILWVVMAYLISVTFMVLAVIIAWLYGWYSTGTPNVSQGLQITHELVGPSTVAFVTFVAGCFVDTNNNNVPDNIEKSTMAVTMATRSMGTGMSTNQANKLNKE